jgi:hypothetical protein
MKTHFTDSFKLISLNKKSGFASGNLEGLKDALGECIALMNNDAEADGRWLEELVKAMDNDPKVGVYVPPRLLHMKPTL